MCFLRTGSLSNPALRRPRAQSVELLTTVRAATWCQESTPVIPGQRWSMLPLQCGIPATRTPQEELQEPDEGRDSKHDEQKGALPFHCGGQQKQEAGERQQIRDPDLGEGPSTPEPAHPLRAWAKTSDMSWECTIVHGRGPTRRDELSGPRSIPLGTRLSRRLPWHHRLGIRPSSDAPGVC